MAYAQGKWAGVALILLAACGDDVTFADGGPDATSDATEQDSATKDATASDTGSDAQPSDAGVDGEGGVVPLDCDAYCNTITTLCTGGNTQFIDKATCLAVCATIPNDAGADASSGNSLACRGHFLALAATDAGGNCAHAGAYGFGACGSICEDFCAIYGHPCDVDAGWGGESACVTECGTIPGATDPTGPWTDAGPDDDNPDMPCREFWLESAFGDAGACDTSSQFPFSGCVQL
ncbi:MAG TPA: hypothetical protein VGH28_15055 [Polyangiaceae bacterium]|jgi:hypothetical protein